MQFEFFQYICIEIETYIPVQAQMHDLDWNKRICWCEVSLVFSAENRKNEFSKQVKLKSDAAHWVSSFYFSDSAWQHLPKVSTGGSPGMFQMIQCCWLAYLSMD